MAPIDVQEMKGRIDRWLLSSPLMSDGHVLSWTSQSDPGYVYPEIEGLYVSWCIENRHYEEAGTVLGQLSRSLTSHPFAARHGIDYLFDTAMIAGALAAALEVGLFVPRSVAVSVYESTCAMLGNRFARMPPTVSTHWSDLFGPHQLKAFGCVCRLAEALGQPRPTWDSMSEPMAQTKAWLDGLSDSDSLTSVYTHPLCYAAEGLIWNPCPAAFDTVSKLCETLAANQTRSGGMPQWLPVDETSVVAGDATAQAIRIWKAHAPNLYSSEIVRATQALAHLLADSGAIFYSSASSHENTWASMMASQALQECVQFLV